MLGLFQEGGHFYTVYAVALAKGYSGREAYKMAYFTQLPDEVGAYSAWENLWQWGTERALQNQWLHDVQEALHSLHGGDVQKRRDCLRKLIGDPSIKVVDRGLLLHAFGDAYAHSFVDPKTKQEQAYKYPYGHGHAGSDPDFPALRPELYETYVNDLASSLPAGPLAQRPELVSQIIRENHYESKVLETDQGLIDDWIQVLAYPNRYTPEAAQRDLIQFIIDKVGYPNVYRPENGTYSDNHPAGADDLGTLSRVRVQQLMDKIKNGCCEK